MNSPEPVRLSDRILKALELAIEQKDVVIAEGLLRLLEMSVTRNAGGADFIERRDYSPAITDAIHRVNVLKKG